MDWKNKLFFGDCLEILQDMYNQNKEGFIDLIYIDPPFNSKRNYNILFENADINDIKAQKEAFADTWSNVSYKDTLNALKERNLDIYNYLHVLDQVRISKSAISYLTTMAIRLVYMHKVLKETGSFFLHCDPTMSHYLKVICDLIFGEKNFKNEIVWSYKRYTAVSNRFQRLHDIILFYTKSDEYFFQDQREDYGEKSGTADSHYKKDDDGNWFRWQKRKGQEPYKVYLSEGRRTGDVWEISHINASAKERLGYPTQKPENLLKKIITSSSKINQLVADFFCGCGTTISVAQNLERKWIGVDISHLAIGLIERRLMDAYGERIKDTYEVHGFPKDIASAKSLANEVKHGRMEFQKWIIEAEIGGVCNPKLTADGGWDGHLTFDMQGEKKVILIEVKSGNVNVKNLREFIHVVKKQEADIGVFVCFKEQITKPMQLAAKDEGYFAEDLYGQLFDKIQILTVEDILDDKRIGYPTSRKETFKRAERKSEKGDQGKLDL